MPSFLFYAFIAWVLQETSGHYDAFWAAALAAGVGVFLVVVGAPKAWLPRLEAPAAVRLFPGLLAAWFSFQLWRAPGVVYPASAERLRLLSCVLAASFAAVTLCVIATLLAGRADSRRERAAFWLAVGLLFAARAAVLYASPSPYIDVFSLTNQASDYLLSGLNPYSQPYTDLYQGASGYPPGPHYWPGYYAWSVPFRALGDIRIGSIAADVVTMIFLHAIVLRLGGEAATARPLALAWLAFPVSLFVLEQAWIDPAIVALTAVLAWCLLERKWRLAGCLLGFGAAMKQYMPLLPFVTLLFVFRHHGRRAFVAALAPAAAVFGLVTIPFLVLDPQAFLQQTLWTYLQRDLRLDALTLPAFLANEYGLVLSNAALIAIYGVALLAGAGLTLRRSATVRTWSGGLAATFGLLFVFGKQAFCNYYYFLAFVVLLAAIDEQFGKAEDSQGLTEPPGPM
jgi:hypothetical protein